jgi:anti-sigma B factor antagonist
MQPAPRAVSGGADRHPVLCARALKGFSVSFANVSYGQRHGWTLIQISGELDLTGVSAVRERLHGTIWEGCRHLVVDLSRLEFCDSTGFAALIAGRRHMMARGGEIRLVLPDPGSKVREILNVFGTPRLFEVFDSAAEAVAAPCGTARRETVEGPRGRGRIRSGLRALGSIPRQRR